MTRVLAVLVLLLLAASPLLPATSAAQESPRVIEVQVGSNGWNGDPNGVVKVEEGELVEFRFIYADNHLAEDNPHAVMIEELELQTEAISRDNPVTTLRWRAESVGTFTLICTRKCQGHNNMQSGQVQVVPFGTLAAAPATTPDPAPAATPDPAPAATPDPAPATTPDPAPAATPDPAPAATPDPAPAATPDPAPAATPDPAPAAATPQVTHVDLIAVPPAAAGDRTELRARVTTHAGTPLEGVTVAFDVHETFIISEWIPVGQARTDANGEAVLRFRPSGTAEQTVRARYGGNTRYQPAEQEMALAVPGVQPVYGQEQKPLVPGLGFWLLWLIVGSIWLIYLFIFYQLRQIAVEG